MSEVQQNTHEPETHERRKYSHAHGIKAFGKNLLRELPFDANFAPNDCVICKAVIHASTLASAEVKIEPLLHIIRKSQWCLGLEQHFRRLRWRVDTYLHLLVKC